MVAKFTNALSIKSRIVILLMCPFAAIVGLVLATFFGVFSPESYELIASVFRGDTTRIGNFLVFMLIFLLSVIVPSIMVIATLRQSIFQPNQVVSFDPDRRVLTVHHSLPWSKPRSWDYRFEDVEAAELTYDSEQYEILLHLFNRKRPLKLMWGWGSKARLKDLQDMGIPIK